MKMKYLEFKIVSIAMLALIGSSFAASVKLVGDVNPKRQPGSKYVTPIISSVTLPEYKGKRYRAVVPDTLDLQGMSKLLMNGMTNCVDEGNDYRLYWIVLMKSDGGTGVWNKCNRPVMQAPDSSMQTLVQRGIPLNRLISGDTRNREVEHRWLETNFHRQGSPDSLIYFKYDGVNPYSYVLDDGWVLQLYGIYYSITGDSRYKDAGQAIVDGINNQIVHRDDYAFYPKQIFAPGEVSDPGAVIPDVYDSCVNGWLLHSLVAFHRNTGYQPAIDLAGEVANYIYEHCGLYDTEGNWVGDFQDQGQHFAIQAGPMFGLADYAFVTGNADMLEFARKAYEYGKHPDQGSSELLGFFPEWASKPPETAAREGEICANAFMIDTALTLALAGAGDGYWDDVDRYVRNHYAECQLKDYKWMYEVYSDAEPPIIGSGMSDDRVGRRNIGNFASWPTANDYMLEHNDGTSETKSALYMHCCTGEASAAIYRVWNNIVHYDSGNLKVNLLLNHVSNQADINSHIPYEGKVEVKVKTSCDLSIRIPEWVTPGQATCQVNGQSRSLTYDGRYAVVGFVNAQDTAVLSFPISEQVHSETIQGTAYTITTKGNDVVDISPEGTKHPFYQREHYRSGTTKFKTVERFVSDELIDSN